MPIEKDVIEWWDRMTPAQRIEQAKELKLCGPDGDWSGPWRELNADQQMRIRAALDGLFGGDSAVERIPRST
jgi:hypothetical protein